MDLMRSTIYETMQRFEQRLTTKFKQTQSPPFETIFQSGATVSHEYEALQIKQVLQTNGRVPRVLGVRKRIPERVTVGHQPFM